ncbi:hypothetical protein [Streptomyces sp. NPDC058644]|uniref:hypothetical protein n=1 Tax=unclassified Streptomyces TaxID=2593676 RepID=UPI003664CCDB
MARRTLPTVTALVTSAALLLTACGGGGGDDSSDRIEGAGKEGDKAAASASPSKAPNQPDLTLPSDLDLSFDFAKPSDPKHAAALDSAQNYIRALNHGIVKQDAEDPAYKFYSTSDAAQYAKSQIQAWIKGNWTPTGKDVYSKSQVSPVGGGKNVRATFCRNQAEYFSKKIKTGKTNRTDENLDSYQRFSLLMTPPDATSKVWQVRQIRVEGRVEECKS